MLKSAPVPQKKEGNGKQETNNRMVGIKFLHINDYIKILNAINTLKSDPAICCLLQIHIKYSNVSKLKGKR